MIEEAKAAIKDALTSNDVWGWDEDIDSIFTPLAAELARLREKADSYGKQLIDIGTTLGGDARDVISEDKSIAGLVKQKFAALRAAAEAKEANDG